VYLVPTLSINNRPLQQVGTFFSSDILTLSGHNTVSLGVGGRVGHPPDRGAGGRSDPDARQWKAHGDPPPGLFFRYSEENLAARFHIRMDNRSREDRR
jgi:hypothetical protein